METNRTTFIFSFTVLNHRTESGSMELWGRVVRLIPVLKNIDNTIFIFVEKLFMFYKFGILRVFYIFFQIRVGHVFHVFIIIFYSPYSCF